MQLGGEAAPGPPARRPRVLLLIKGLGVGGAERLLVDVVATRDRASFDYEVAYVLTTQDALVPALQFAGVTVHPLGGNASADLRWLGALRRLLVRGRFDILHAHLPYTAALGRIVAVSIPRAERPVLVYTEHSLWNKAAVLTKALNRATVGMDRALFVVTSAARDALPVPLRRRARVVVHGVDRTRFEAARAERARLRRDVRGELGIADNEVLVLAVSNLRGEKGYDVLLEAARLSVARGAPLRFVAAGRGPLEAHLSAVRDSAGLAGRFVFLGERPDTLRLMAGADIFVLPSHQEGLPVALMEAMCMGLPVVGTTVGGVPDVVTDGVEGILVAPARPDLLADALSRIGRDEVLRRRMADAALARSVMFDVTAAARAVEAVYRQLLEEKT